MASEKNLEALAEDLWSGSGINCDFPRNVERAIAMTLPLAIVKLPQLDSENVKAWMNRRGVQMALPDQCHDLMGCLVAHRGRGLAFVCGSDDPQEQRLTIAHEAAHFLLDYLHPRRQVIEALGAGVEDVLDGLRAASPAERAGAVLSHVRLGPHVHVLPRGDPEENSAPLVCRESRADELAIEFVAPKSRVTCLYRELLSRGVSERDVIDKLANHFGLPAYVFEFTTQRIERRRPVSFLREAIPRIRGRHD